MKKFIDYIFEKTITKNKSHFIYFALIYLSGIILFAFSRLIFIIYNFKQVPGIPFTIIFNAFFMGWRFDTVITCYIISIPFLLYSLVSIFNLRFKIFSNFIISYLIILFSLGLLICFADVPYYAQFAARFNYNALKLDTSAVIFKTIFEDFRHILFIILYLISVITFSFFILKIHKYVIKERWISERISGLRFHLKTFLFSIFLAAVIFLGIRGRVSTSPIRWGTAFTSEYPFANHLGLNPVFTFFRSYLDEKDSDNIRFNLIDEEYAGNNVKQYFNITDTSIYNSPLARKYPNDGKPLNCNLVMIIMESMTAHKMGTYGNPDHLTPFLDSIVTKSLLFRNFYSDGIHTYSGIYASLYGFPTLKIRHPFRNTENMQRYGGLPLTLFDNGYNTIFFCTQDEQWGNFGGFLTCNGFQNIISRKDYPFDEVEGLWGAPDHVMFREAIPILDKLSKEAKPFFATLVTSSDHGPYKLPKGIDFKPRSNKVDLQLVEYADWAIENFIKELSKKDWFQNTIFVFVADHGVNFKPSYEISLPYHYIPLIIYSPKYIKAGEISKLGEQIDIYPTLLDILNIPFVNNSFGIDLMKESHKYLFFTSDENLGCLDEEYFYINTKTGEELLHKYKSGNLTDFSGLYPAKTQEMATYSKSMLQTAQWFILNRKVRYIPFL
jgi:phosphoglycerol transferase MdoB-like AlkP superfamily enzyme